MRNMFTYRVRKVVKDDFRGSYFRFTFSLRITVIRDRDLRQSRVGPLCVFLVCVEIRVS